VSVVGDFNHWDGRRTRCESIRARASGRSSSRLLEEGTVYKYEIKPKAGPPFVKADPVGFKAEVRRRRRR
jgi:1,4-alpha-glucan branching enzyme